MTETSKTYRNLFVEYGYDKQAISNRLETIFETIFNGSEEDRLYFEGPNQTAYVIDTGNDDVRTEGMSYAMMACVQLDKQELFNKLWKWSKTYMYMTEGENKGYFAWSVQTNGEKNSDGPAPDGEEYFAMALFFAANRWGNGEGIFHYDKEAKQLLSDCIHKGENNDGYPMWHPQNKQIKFVPNCDFTDPSYHLPHFYRLFSEWGNPEDREFWLEAADASVLLLKKACHPVSGLSAEYTNYDGSPVYLDHHYLFYSDSYRVAGNIGLANEWFGNDNDLNDCVTRLQRFFCETVVGKENLVYEIDGQAIQQEVLHPVGLVAANAMGSLATKGAYAEACVRKFWDTPLRKGDRRYYDNFLYLFAFMALSGNYRIWGK